MEEHMSGLSSSRTPSTTQHGQQTANTSLWQMGADATTQHGQQKQTHRCGTWCRRDTGLGNANVAAAPQKGGPGDSQNSRTARRERTGSTCVHAGGSDLYLCQPSSLTSTKDQYHASTPTPSRHQGVRALKPRNPQQHALVIGDGDVISASADNVVRCGHDEGAFVLIVFNEPLKA